MHKPKRTIIITMTTFTQCHATNHAQLPASMSPLVFVLMATGSSPSMQAWSIHHVQWVVALQPVKSYLASDQPAIVQCTRTCTKCCQFRIATCTVMYHGRFLHSIALYRHELITEMGSTTSYSKCVAILKKHNEKKVKYGQHLINLG